MSPTGSPSLEQPQLADVPTTEGDGASPSDGVVSLETARAQLDVQRLGLFAKLAEVFLELDDVERDKRHENQGWTYASADAVLRAVREPLRRRAVLVLSSTRGESRERVFKTSGGKDRVVVTVGLTFTFVDSETGQTWSCDWEGAGADEAEKGLSKAITVGMRTFLRDQFLLPEGEDSAGGGDRRNAAGERLASAHQRDQISRLASGKLSGCEFLNTLRAACSEGPVEVSEEDAISQIPGVLEALTTKQANATLDILREQPEAKA